MIHKADPIIPNFSDLFRPNRPPVEVYVTDGPDAIRKAPPGLSADVNEDLETKRQSMLQCFGNSALDFVEPTHLTAITRHYADAKLSIAPTCVVDPVTDATKVREVFLSGFPDRIGADMFAGTNDAAPTPGGEGALDIVILHDSRDHYKKLTIDQMAKLRFTRLVDGELERMVTLHITDLVAHEEGHMTTGQETEGVVMQRDDDSPTGYIHTDLSHLSYIDTSEVLPRSSAPVSEGTYYSGDAISEGIAARHASKVVAPLRECTGPGGRQARKAEHDFLIYGRARRIVEPRLIMQGIHSTEAGIALEKLVRKRPAVETAIATYEEGKTSYLGLLNDLQKHVPRNILELGHRPTNQAWRQFRLAIEKL